MRVCRLPILKPAASRRSGAATVETALVLPIFFMVLLGMVEIGRAFMVSQLLTNAAREGARIAIMNNSTNTEVVNAVGDIVQRTIGVAPADVTVNILVSEHAGNPSTSNNVALAKKRDLCEVEVQVAYTKVNMIPVKYFSGATLTGQAAMRHE
ncbi:MAG: TadE/TadG family type IV pilus assembly protein [Planctomycetaceae bacterium]